MANQRLIDHLPTSINPFERLRADHQSFAPPTGWAVDQAILNEEDRVVVIRFGHDYCPVCMQMDEALSKIVIARVLDFSSLELGQLQAEKVKNFAVIYLVDITEVPDFNTMYERSRQFGLVFCRQT